MSNFYLVTILCCFLIVQCYGGLQSVGIKGRLVCGTQNEKNVKVKLIDKDIGKTIKNYFYSFRNLMTAEPILRG